MNYFVQKVINKILLSNCNQTFFKWQVSFPKTGIFTPFDI